MLRKRWLFLIAAVAGLPPIAHAFAGSAIDDTLPPVSMWGDSQTAGSSGYGDRLAALLPTRRSYNEGIGGQRIEMIAARMGAVPTILRRSLVLPASGRVELAAADLSIDLLHAPSGQSLVKVDVAGTSAVLRYRAGTDPKSGRYTLARIQPTNAPTSLAAGAAVFATSGIATSDPDAAPPLSSLLKGVVLIRAGRNNLSDPSFDIAKGLDLMDKVVRHVERHTARIIVIGQMLGYIDLPPEQGGKSLSPAKTITLFESVSRWNDALAARYPGYYTDVQAYHVTHGGGQPITLADGGQTRTFTVLTAAAPQPILRDGLHENAAGQRQTAEQMRAILAERSY
jgi:hypothetical protein